MKRICLICIYLLIYIQFSSCRNLLDPFREMTTVDPCDPSGSVYQADSHYFERDFLRVDGSLDYKKIERLNQPRTSPCDPLYDASLIHTAPAE